jgi:hypothetical protein
MPPKNLPVGVWRCCVSLRSARLETILTQAREFQYLLKVQEKCVTSRKGSRVPRATAIPRPYSATWFHSGSLCDWQC